jgi:hypothetical protein
MLFTPRRVTADTLRALMVTNPDEAAARAVEHVAACGADLAMVELRRLDPSEARAIGTALERLKARCMS